MKFKLLLLQLFLVLSVLSAQSDVYERLPLTTGSRADLPSPAEFLGYELGQRFTEYARSVEYFRMLAEKSDRINIEKYGATYEQRPLLLLTISSLENMARIDEIKANQKTLVARTQVQGKDKEEINLDRHPVINSYSYNIHGNEASSTEAAMQVAWELATTNDPVMLDALRKTVNLLFVCINPDGRDRYVYWANSVARQTGGEEPRDLEHYAPWPNGRTNHYWFDLNRDWVWGVHPESRGHTTAYQEWMPQVHTDYHEQGYDANYFTVPGTTPRNLLLPDAYEVWADTFGRANITEFNKKGLSYFTRDRFDFYYPSYGSSYPSVMGAIGMLTEQGGIGGHRAVETEDGYVLTFRQRVYDHYTTSIAQVKAAARNRRELIDYSLEAWDPLNSKSDVNAYVIENDGSEFFEDVLKMLLLNGVEVLRTKETVSSSAINFRDGKQSNRSFPAGSLIIGTEQPRHLFVNSILSRDLQIEDSVMYDMSTWSAPLAYNLEAYSVASPISVDTEPVVWEDKIGKVITIGDASDRAYAYVIRWNQRTAPKALAKIWKMDYRVRAAHEPFTADDGTAFPAGSLIVLAGRNPDKTNIDADMRQLAQAFDVDIHRLATGRMKEGMDLASTRNFPVKQPKVALLVEPPFNVYTSGQIYFLFDWETELPVDRIRASTLMQTAIPKFGSRYGLADLNDYDVLILPEARNLDDVFGQDEQRKLKDWLSGGGTIVAVGSSAEFFTKESGFLKPQELSRPEDEDKEGAAALNYNERTDYFGKKRIPGSALNATVDVSHPLAFGVKSDVYTLKFGNTALVPDASLQSVGRYVPEGNELLAAGYASRPNLDSLAGKTWAGVRPYGRGRIVYFIDNPHYRMFWRGPSRMMQNAVMVVPGM
ncbi:peptidase M14 [Neolewinella aurantiaca]|uniref:Peptidase M14 n=1 Tax=Neolewinella aurantiaca TaxID=2602767 RepID=A0A5C7FM83_9BACT|nr:M14 family zinc carboxypeptidase [Neolewinella aurantiaca]TXF91780.1 peptidase M14 [Neolewinella aurantiaca]